MEYEGELVAVIKTETKNISEEKALDCVAGYTLGNDISERTWQKTDRTLWRAKSADTFKPMGPAIVSGIDPMNQQIEVRINGKTVSSYNTRGMIFSVAQYLSRMSRYVTLHPGDIVWFGCDAATLPALQPGDLVEVVNDAIGVPAAVDPAGQIVALLRRDAEGAAAIGVLVDLRPHAVDLAVALAELEPVGALAFALAHRRAAGRQRYEQEREGALSRL